MTQPTRAERAAAAYYPPVMIVDDNPKLGRLVIEIFRRLGFQNVDLTTSAAEALEAIKAGSYGLIVSDYDLAPMNGLDFLKTVKSDEALYKIAFILTEDTISFEQVTAAHAAGVDAFLLKPFDIPLLKTKLASVLGSRRPRKRISPDWGKDLTSYLT